MQYSNAFLVVLPPENKSPEELSFWCNVASDLNNKDITMFHIGTEALPTDDAVSIVLPREPLLFNKMDNLSKDVPTDWISPQFIESILEREYLRGTAKINNAEAFEGLSRLANLSEEIIKIVQPQWILTWDKVIHVCAFFYQLGKHYSIPTYIAEKAPLNNQLWLEPEGLHGESGLWHMQMPEEIVKYAEIGKKAKANLIENVYGFRRPKDMNKLGCCNVSPNYERPIFFLPLDTVYGGVWMPRSHPLSKSRYPLYQNPGVALEDLWQEIKKLNGRLLLRKHPTCRYINPDVISDGVELVEGKLDEYLKAADVVICFCTKVAFPALALEKPVVTLSPNIAACSGATYHCLSKNKLHETLLKALNKENLQGRLEKVEPYLGWLENSYFYSLDGSSTRDSAALVSSITSGYESGNNVKYNEEDVNLIVSTINRLTNHYRPPRKTILTRLSNFIMKKLAKLVNRLRA